MHGYRCVHIFEGFRIEMEQTTHCWLPCVYVHTIGAHA